MKTLFTMTMGCNLKTGSTEFKDNFYTDGYASKSTCLIETEGGKAIHGCASWAKAGDQIEVATQRGRVLFTDTIRSVMPADKKLWNDLAKKPSTSRIYILK